MNIEFSKQELFDILKMSFGYDGKLKCNEDLLIKIVNNLGHNYVISHNYCLPLDIVIKYNFLSNEYIDLLFAYDWEISNQLTKLITLSENTNHPSFKYAVTIPFYRDGVFINKQSYYETLLSYLEYKFGSDDSFIKEFKSEIQNLLKVNQL